MSEAQWIGAAICAGSAFVAWYVFLAPDSVADAFESAVIGFVYLILAAIPVLGALLLLGVIR